MISMFDTWTNADHQAALQAAKNGTADKYQQTKLAEAAKQAGPRGEAAKQALAENERRFGKR